MTIKASSIMSMLFLCGSVFVIAPTFGIRCSRMVCEGEWCYGDVGEVDCEGADDDRCGTLTFTTEGSVHNVIRNCTRSTHDCNQESTCQRVENAIAEWGVSFSDCSMTCCEGNVCNAPEEEFKLEEEEDDQPVKGKKSIAMYHLTSGRSKSSKSKLHGKWKDSATLKSTKEKLAKLASSIRF